MNYIYSSKCNDPRRKRRNVKAGTRHYHCDGRASFIWRTTGSGRCASRFTANLLQRALPHRPAARMRGPLLSVIASSSAPHRAFAFSATRTSGRTGALLAGAELRAARASGHLFSFFSGINARQFLAHCSAFHRSLRNLGLFCAQPCGGASATRRGGRRVAARSQHALRCWRVVSKYEQKAAQAASAAFIGFVRLLVKAFSRGMVRVLFLHVLPSSCDVMRTRTQTAKKKSHKTSTFITPPSPLSARRAAPLQRTPEYRAANRLGDIKRRTDGRRLPLRSGGAWARVCFRFLGTPRPHQTLFASCTPQAAFLPALRGSWTTVRAPLAQTRHGTFCTLSPRFSRQLGRLLGVRRVLGIGASPRRPTHNVTRGIALASSHHRAQHRSASACVIIWAFMRVPCIVRAGLLKSGNPQNKISTPFCALPHHFCTRAFCGASALLYRLSCASGVNALFWRRFHARVAGESRVFDKSVHFIAVHAAYSIVLVESGFFSAQIFVLRYPARAAHQTFVGGGHLR